MFYVLGYEQQKGMTTKIIRFRRRKRAILKMISSNLFTQSLPSQQQFKITMLME